MIRRLLREPLVHFLVLALAIFALYGALKRDEPAQGNEIVVTGARIEQLTGLFAKTWQRPPNTAELKGLIDDYVKEEVLYREALALGLDKDDTVIRRRLRLKMEFLSEAQAEAVQPTEAELEAFLRKNPERFRVEPTLAFQQIFFSPERRGNTIEQDIGSVLDVLRAKPDLDHRTLGDPTILPSELPLTRQSAIGQVFGMAFAETLASAPPGIWTGPVKSSFGLHVVRVIESQPGGVAPLEQIRDRVAQAWTQERRRQAEEALLAERLKRYRVRIETQAQNAAAAGKSP